MLKPSLPGPQNGTLLGNRVVADVISKDEVALEQGGPQPHRTGVLITREGQITEVWTRTCTQEDVM